MNLRDIIKTVKSPSQELLITLVAIVSIFGYVQGVVVPSVANQSAAVSRSYNALAPGQGPCIPSTTVKCGMIRIVKDTIPNNYQDFTFSVNIPGYQSTFTLDDDATLLNPSSLSNVKYFNVFNGSYIIAETPAVPGFSVSVSCVDPSGGTTTSGASTNISVSSYENVTCIFKNTGASIPQEDIYLPTAYLDGTITIIKNTIPDAYQDFTFSGNIPGYPGSFILDDDATLTHPSAVPNSLVFAAVTNGSYTITETGSIIGYTTTVACIDPSGGTTTSGVTANISVSNGENVVCTFTNTSNTVCTPNTWTQKADFGGGTRVGAVGFSIGNKGYMGTGLLNQDFWEYNPVIDAWIQKVNFGGGDRSWAVGFSIGNKGYIGTGLTNGAYSSDFWEYNPSANMWTQKANYSGGMNERAVGFSIGNKGYVGTGAINNYYQDFYEYDPVMNIWAQKANFAGGTRNGAVGFSINSKGYIGTGYSNVLNSPVADFWEYDPTTNLWAQKANFGGGPRHNATGFSLGGKGYIGTGANNVNYQDFYEYCP